MAGQYIRYTPLGGSGSGGVTSINGATGPAINILPGTGISVGTVGNNITITNTSPGTTPTGPANTLARFNSLGNLADVPNWSVNNSNGTLNTNINGAQPGIVIVNLNSGATSSGSVTALNVDTTNLTAVNGINGVNMNFQNSSTSAGSIHGLNISLDTSSAPTGEISAININVGSATDSNPQGVRGFSSDGRIQVNASTQLLSAQGFQIGSRLEHAFLIPNGSPVTGTDSLAVNIAGDMLIEDNIADGPTAGLVGISGVGFISSLGVALGKTVDTLNVFLPASAFPDPGFTTGGTVTNFTLIRSAPPLNQGGSLNITNLYGLKIDTGLAAIATNSWGIYIADPTSNNHFGGPVDMKQLQLNGATSGRLDINAAAVTSSYALTMPAAQGTSGQTLSNNGSGVLSWVTPTAGTVTSVSASSPLASSGGATPNISLTGQVAIANGGTGASTKAAGFDALSPMTTGGDLIYGGASGTGTRLANGTAGQVLQSNGTTTAPSWATPTVYALRDLSNLTTTSINQNLLPATDGGENLGSASLQWEEIHARTIVQVFNSMALERGVSTPSGVVVDALHTLNASTNLGVYTQTAATSKPLQLETGNGTSGNSGNIVLQTGTSTATRGDVTISALNINLNAATQISANSKKIVSVQDPTSAQDAATKNYVDSIAGGAPAVFQDQKSSGTAAGTFTSGAWQTRTINTTVTSQTFASLSANQITLSAGTYQIVASAPAFQTQQHQTRLQNITDATTAIIGTSEICGVVDNIQTRSLIDGVVTIAGSKAFEVQHQCASTKATNGFGVAGSFGTEIYCQISIRKIS